MAPVRRVGATRRFVLIGNLDNRRITGFVEALAGAGWPPPIRLAHQDLIADPSRLAALPDEPLFVRIDSVGEDPQVERMLLERGAAALPDAAGCERISATELARRPPQHGQLLAPRQHHVGLLDYLGGLERICASKPAWQLLNPIADLRVLFDKVEGSRRYAAAGIPVPDPLPDMDTITSAGQLRAAMRRRGWPSVFVKLSCGSSASGVALYRHAPQRPAHERDMVLTTVAQTDRGRFNSLRLQRLEAREQVDAVLDWLLGEGAQIERAIAKPRIGRDTFDLRVLVVAGEPAFIVVRTSPHPITNLHLGGRRGDLEAVKRAVGPEAWAAAMGSCERVFAEHRCLHVGVDLLFEPDLVRHRVIEANAFGDLLPGLTHAGLDVYAFELAALARDRFSTPPRGPRVLAPASAPGASGSGGGP